MIIIKANWRSLTLANYMRKFRFIIGLFLIGATAICKGQNTATLSGYIKDSSSTPMQAVTITASKGNAGAFSDAKGYYSIIIPAGDSVSIRYSYLGYLTQTITVFMLKGESRQYSINLKRSSVHMKDVTISDQQSREDAGMQVISEGQFEAMPNPTGGIETAIKLISGASANNELTSNYSVRGGSYDENLIYVNDFEIYRPLLLSNAQQEGLSFINPDMVSSVLFSTGGFQAKYGDKMSSVLDVHYKKPDHFAASIEASLLGFNLHVEGSSKNHKLTYIAGVREKQDQYLLNSLNTQAQYQPSFSDGQAYITYNFSDKLELDALGYFSYNTYRYIPISQTTAFGLVNEALQLDVLFSGQELDEYTDAMGGLSLTYQASKKFTLKFLASGFNDQENETNDITGEYLINQLGTNLGQSNFAQPVYALGAGATQDFTRDYLNALVLSTGVKATYTAGNHFFIAGLQVKRQTISYNIDEWEFQDSAGYSLPYNTNELVLSNVIKSDSTIVANNYSGFIQDNWIINSLYHFNLNYGVRFNYSELDNQLIVSPRAQLSYKPLWEKNYVFRLSGGNYSQPPFFREMLNPQGQFVDTVKAQQSWQAVLGVDHEFKMLGGRPFKFVVEAYYKYITDLNPYNIDNDRITYLATNDAKGYATGLDIRLNGELVKGAESWIDLSILSAKEDLFFDTTHTESGAVQQKGYIPSPTDQTVNFSMYFQDYVPNHPNLKVHLALIFGSGLPFSAPNFIQYRDIFTMPPYRRVDIGFSALLVDGKKQKSKNKFLGNFKSIWASLEVFNLLGVLNTVSYTWVNVNNPSSNITQFAVPNYLTYRLLNLAIIVKI